MVDEHHITGLFLFVAGLDVGLTDATKSAMLFE
jgi:hypothetical protein